MKLLGLSFFAAALAGSVAMAAPAAAQDRHVEVRRTTTVVHDDRRSGWHNDHRRVCRTHWQNHRKVRRCFRR